MVLAIVSFVVVTGIGLSIFLTGYGAHNDKILYQERLHQMQEVTSELFGGIERVIKITGILRILCAIMRNTPAPPLMMT